jgi:hypothetical protein
MKSIDVETVRLYVNGITHTLELAQPHAKEKNLRGAEIELYNAMVELQVLREELDQPDADDKAE